MTSEARGKFNVGANADNSIIVNENDIQVSESYVEGLFSVGTNSGDGDLSYANGVFDYTGPTASEVRAHPSGGYGITYSGGTIALTILKYRHRQMLQ